MVHRLKMAQPTQTDPQFKLRLPSDLKDRIQSAASKNNRSMNAEIVATLEDAYTPVSELAMLTERLQAVTAYYEATDDPAQRKVLRTEMMYYSERLKEALKENPE